ncbi:glycosyltransferase family 2 protein [Halomonas sp. HNIBRBA4712]|uniref:glycosyltransferase family 2 protein n=1 Tax=Halomonas sp. HNIBRBA4712 TaxID=3373087 RepID=UPI003746E907
MAISAVLIVKNEAHHLRACLETLTFADEIVVLDAGSSDETLMIAREFTDNVSVNADWQGFGVQRQRAEALAHGEWILMIDADERVTDELRQSILAAVERRPAVYRLARLSWCFGRFIRHSGWYPDRVERLYPRGRASYNAALVHEKLVVPDTLETLPLEGDLLHYTYRDVRHYLEKSAHYADAWAEQRAARGKTASIGQGVVHALGCFLKMYVLKAGFRDGGQGLLLAILSAHSTFNKYAALWVRGKPGPHER